MKRKNIEDNENDNVPNFKRQKINNEQQTKEDES